MDKLDEKLKQIFSEDLDISKDFENIFNADILKNSKKTKTIKINKLNLSEKSDKNIIKSKISKIAATIILEICIAVGTVYAGMVGLNFLQYKNKVELSSEVDEDWSKYFSMQEISGYERFFYKILNNYDEYHEFSKLWKNISVFSKEDFEDNSVLVLISKTGNGNIYIDKIEDDNNIITIYLKRDKIEDIDDECKMLTTLLPKKIESNNISFKFIAGLDMKEHIEMERFLEQYEEENVIPDNCFVIKNGYVISNNKNQLEEFIERSEKNVECEIRIINYEDILNSNEKRICITDLIYKEGTYDLCSYLIYNEEKIMSYFVGHKIIKKSDSKIFQNRNVFKLTLSQNEENDMDEVIVCSYYK